MIYGGEYKAEPDRNDCLRDASNVNSVYIKLYYVYNTNFKVLFLNFYIFCNIHY